MPSPQPKKAAIKGQRCPLCYKEGKTADLDYQAGRFTHFCPNGHEFNDTAELRALLAELPQPEPPPPSPEQPSGAVVIDEINHARLAALIGNFKDASGLFGAVYALNQELEAAAAQKAAVVVAGSTIEAGDLIMQVRIPEAYVQQLKDIAQSGGMTPDQFMNVRIAEACANQWWFFWMLCVISHQLWLDIVRMLSATTMA
jgi:hypothetical protein